MLPASRARPPPHGRSASLQSTGRGSADASDGLARRATPVADRAPRPAAGLLRGRRDGDQGARLDGAGLRAAGVLLPRDRAQPARGRPVPGAGRGVRRRRRRGARRAPRSCSRPTARRPRSWRRPATESRFVVNAVCPLVTKVHHEAKVRAGKGFTVLYVGHAGHDEAVGTLAVAPDAIRLVEHEDDLDDRARRPSTTRRRSRCSRRPPSRCTTGRASPIGPATAFPELWTATRNDLCFATTNRQAALQAIAAEADAIVVIGSANSSNTIALAKVATRGRVPDACCASTAPTSSTSTRSATRAIVGVTAGASAPEDLVQAVIARLAPDRRASSPCTSPTRTSTSRRRASCAS